MDIEKLIEQYRQAADKWEKRHPVTDTFDLRVQDALRDAATALSTLQAENEKLRAELEQVRRERDAAQSLLAERIGVRGAEPITTAFGLPIDRLRELAKADREGRCVVLPCKIGDYVYVIDEGDYQSDHKPYVRAKEVTEISWKKSRRGKDLGFGVILKGGDCNTSARYKFSSIGETVFLTRAEAEAALRREQDG